MVFHTTRITLNRCFQIELILHTGVTELLQENEDPRRLKGFSLAQRDLAKIVVDFRLWCSIIKACNSKRKKKAIENTGSTLIGCYRDCQGDSKYNVSKIRSEQDYKIQFKSMQKKAKRHVGILRAIDSWLMKHFWLRKQASSSTQVHRWIIVMLCFSICSWLLPTKVSDWPQPVYDQC